MFELEKWGRPRVQRMKPYSSARDEFSGKASVYVDANENPFGTIPQNEPYNRYPHPLQPELKQAIAQMIGNGVLPENIFLGNGSDEAIDLLIRIGCEPNQDEVLITPPTYGMYAISADINSVGVREVSLLPDFQLDLPALFADIQANTKIIFLCSPNNPTGNSLKQEDILKVLQHFQGVVVVDEAYIDFSNEPSWVGKLGEFPNLVILRTFSKAWGMAALRLGMAIASPALINYLNKVKSPYNINALTHEYVLKALAHAGKLGEAVQQLKETREYLREALEKSPQVAQVFPSDANFLLVKLVSQARKTYENLLRQGIVVRDRSAQPLCGECLRITVGTPEEMAQVIEAFAKDAEMRTKNVDFAK